MLGPARRWALTGAALFVLAASPADAEPRLIRFAAPDFGYAEWLPDGSGFYVVGDGSLQRYDVEGRRRDAKITLHGLPDDAVIAPPGFAHQALSADGKRLALVVNVPGVAAPQVWIAELPSGNARPTDVLGDVMSLDWTRDGQLVGARFGEGRFLVDVRGKSSVFCAAEPGRFVHAHPDGRSLVVAANDLRVVDAGCRVRESFSPWPDGENPSTAIGEFSYSPSRAHVALLAASGVARVRLWVESLDHRENMDTSCEPEAGPILWLDEDTLVVLRENGDAGTSQHRLERVEWRTGRRRPLLPTKPSCTDVHPSAPPHGGAVVFQRLCDDPADSFVGLVRAR